MDYEQRNAIVDMVEATLGSDGVISDAEREFLKRLIRKFGLSEDQRADRVVMSSAGRTTGTLRKFSHDDQLRIVALLVDAAVADGVVVPEERALLLAAAAALGIEACALEERIAKRLAAVSNGTP